MTRIADTLGGIIAWLRTMRGTAGYTGPVSHWWESSLLFSGTMIDWRYEGIICGFVNLFHSTNDEAYLTHAIEAAEDVVRSQLPSGRYLNSSFQFGAVDGGTPHEAAVDVGLLELARLLKAQRKPEWTRYFDVARRNIEGYLVGDLWKGHGFVDQDWNDTLVPNKNATAMRAMMLYGELAGKDVSRYLIPAASVVLESQVRGTERSGGTVHSGTGHQQLAISIYTARCTAEIEELYSIYPREEYLEFIEASVGFLSRLVGHKGVFFGFDRNSRLIYAPLWVAGGGDVLRALLGARVITYVDPAVITSLVEMLTTNQCSGGGIRTSYGMARKGSLKPFRGAPDFRDVLPVVGWCDKAFRALTLLTEARQGRREPVSIACLWRGCEAMYEEDDSEMKLSSATTTLYRYRKGESFPREFRL